MAEFDDKVIITKQKITDIADQIRTELSETDEYKLDVMPTKIHEVAQGGGSPIDLRTLTISSSSTHFEYNVVGDYAWNRVVGDVTPITGYLNVTENGVYNASEPPYSFYGFTRVIVNVPPTMPDFELVCEYDFTSNTPKKDNARYNIEGNSNYISFDTTKGAVFDSASARFFNTLYNLNDGNSYKIEIEFGDIVLNAQLTGKRNLFGYATNASKVDENSNSFGWDVSSNSFRYHTGAGDRYIDKSVDYWANDTLTMYYGLSVDSEGKLWLPSVSIDNSSSKSLIIMDKDLITKLTSPFQQDNPNFVLGGGNNFYYMEVKKFRIYRINNLTNPPSLMMATPIGEQKSIDESIKEDEKSVENETVEEKTDETKEQNKDSVEKVNELDA